VEGVVLESYGAGNAPDKRKDILQALKEATEKGIIIVNCTQVYIKLTLYSFIINIIQ